MEPNPDNVALLERSVAESGFGHVTVIQAGASAEIGTLALHAASGNGATSAYDPTRGARRTAAGLPIDVALSRRPAPLRLVKIDVEGFEFEALRGAERVLAEDRPVLLLEFAPEGLVGTDGPGLLAWLAARGYGFSVLAGEGPATPCDAAGVMEAFARAGRDHIDIMATPDTPPPT
jgi:FkbM family methyltransferase